MTVLCRGYIIDPSDPATTGKRDECTQQLSAGAEEYERYRPYFSTCKRSCSTAAPTGTRTLKGVSDAPNELDIRVIRPLDVGQGSYTRSARGPAVNLGLL